jgi:hypothetical protein
MLGGAICAWLVAAPPVAVQVDWQAPPECPDRAQVLAELETFLEPATQSTEAPEASSVRATVEALEDGRWRLHMEALVGSGRVERTLESATCAQLARAAALIVSVVLRPTVILERVDRVEDAPAGVEGPVAEPEGPVAEPEPMGRADPPAGPAPPGTTTIAPDEAVQPEAGVRGMFRVHGSVASGVLPGAGPGLGGALGLGGRGWRVEALGSYMFARTGFASRALGAGAEIRAWSVGAQGCGEPRWRWLSVPLCLGAEAGALRAVGVGVAEPREARGAWATVLAGPGLRFAVAAWAALSVGVRGFVSLRRPAFEIPDVGPIHRVAGGGARGELGFEARFGGSSNR